MTTLGARLRNFWGKEERLIFGGNLVFHILVTLIGLLFMPFASFSENSLHDGHLYFTISGDLWPVAPIANLSWHKRILLPLLANLVFPFEKHVAFWLLGVLPASLSAVYFYKISRRYTSYPLSLTWVYSFLPWLVFSAHHGLTEPLMMAFLLAGYYYYLEERPAISIPMYALAVLSKEVALLVVAAQAVLLLWKSGWKRAVFFSVAVVLPFVLFCLLYGFRWGDCAWCLRVEPENGFSLTPGVWWIWQYFFEYPLSSANLQIAWAYNALNQVMNLALLILVLIGIFRLRRIDLPMMVYCAIITIPLFFLGPYVYSLNVNLGRQFMLSSLVLIGYADLFEWQTTTRRFIYAAVLVGMVVVGLFWIVMYTKYFLFT